MFSWLHDRNALVSSGLRYPHMRGCIRKHRGANALASAIQLDSWSWLIQFGHERVLRCLDARGQDRRMERSKSHRTSCAVGGPSATEAPHVVFQFYFFFWGRDTSLFLIVRLWLNAIMAPKIGRGAGTGMGGATSSWYKTSPLGY